MVEISTFFALLEAWEFNRASNVAERIKFRRISIALTDLAKCESQYLSMRYLESSRLPNATGLERRLDATVSELEACLMPPPTAPPHSQPTPLSRATDSPFHTIFMQLVSCQLTPSFCTPRVDATMHGADSPAPEYAHISPTNAAVLKVRN